MNLEAYEARRFIQKVFPEVGARYHCNHVGQQHPVIVDCVSDTHVQFYFEYIQIKSATGFHKMYDQIHLANLTPESFQLLTSATERRGEIIAEETGIF